MIVIYLETMLKTVASSKMEDRLISVVGAVSIDQEVHELCSY